MAPRSRHRRHRRALCLLCGIVALAIAVGAVAWWLVAPRGQVRPEEAATAAISHVSTPSADDETVADDGDGDSSGDHNHRHHHGENDGEEAEEELDVPPPVEEDVSDVGPPDWIAELEDPATGNVREVRAVLRRNGLSYFSPGNFRSALIHTLDDWHSDDDGSGGSNNVTVMAPAVLVLLYRPGSDLCDEAQPKFAALAETVERVLNRTEGEASKTKSNGGGTPPPFVTAVFRVDSYPSQDEIDAGGGGSGGDGADVLRENGAADLLGDVPAVVFFTVDKTARTGIRMARWSGRLDAKETLLRLAHFQRRGGGYASEDAAAAAIDTLLTSADIARTFVGSFTNGTVDL